MIANLFIFVLCVTSISNVLSFSSWNKLATRTGSSLSMAGGRSPAEKGKSVRTMYKEVRNLINDRALDPAFFETGAKPVSFWFVGSFSFFLSLSSFFFLLDKIR